MEIYIYLTVYLYLCLYLYSTIYIVDLCSKGLHFPALPSGAHTTCLLGWVKLVPSHSCCCPWWCSIVLASPKCWGICNKIPHLLHFQYLLLDSLPGLWPCLIVPNLLEPLQSWVFCFIWFCIFTSGLSSKIPALLHSSKLHAFKSSTTSGTLTLPSSVASTRYSLDSCWTTASLCWLCRKCFSLHHYHFLSTADSSPSCPVSAAPVKQRFHFRGLTLWMTADISAPADQNHTVLKFKISNSPHIVFKGFQNSLWNVISQASIAFLSFSSSLQPIKLWALSDFPVQSPFAICS